MKSRELVYILCGGLLLLSIAQEIRYRKTAQRLENMRTIAMSIPLDVRNEAGEK